MKTLKLQCEILSPIHIGTGNELDPLSYLIQGGTLHRVSFERFISDMDEGERAEFEGLLDKGDLIRIRKYVSEHINVYKNCLYSTDVSSKVVSLYNAKINDIQNQLLINSFIRTEGESKPLIPGSSIKGAIRTAVISSLAQNSRLPKPKDYREENEFESIVLGYKDGKDDPFRGLKIRDKIINDYSTIVREVKNVSKKRGGILQSNNMQIICETTHSSLTGKPVEFETEMSFDEGLFSTRFLSKTLTKEQIVKSCNDFYRDKMSKEHEKFYKNSEVEQCSIQLLNIPLDGNTFLIRLGRFSGVECVTLDDYRNPKPPGNKTTWGTTRNLAEGKYPMGWVKVTAFEQ